jgi:hypothetical protein
MPETNLHELFNGILKSVVPRKVSKHDRPSLLLGFQKREELITAQVLKKAMQTWA